jgi:hypothetical protein
MDTSSAVNGEVDFTGLSLDALIGVQASMMAIKGAERKKIFILQCLACLLDTRAAYFL